MLRSNIIRSPTRVAATWLKVDCTKNDTCYGGSKENSSYRMHMGITLFCSDTATSDSSDTKELGLDEMNARDSERKTHGTCAEYTIL